MVSCFEKAYMLKSTKGHECQVLLSSKETTRITFKETLVCLPRAREKSRSELCKFRLLEKERESVTSRREGYMTNGVV